MNDLIEIEITDINKLRKLLAARKLEVFKFLRGLNGERTSAKKLSKELGIDYKNASMIIRDLIDLGLVIRDGDVRARSTIYAVDVDRIIFREKNRDTSPIDQIVITLE